MPNHDSSDHHFIAGPGAGWFLGSCLILLLLFSIYLSLNRIYQVDEAQNLYMARILSSGESGQFFTNAPIWLLGPLSWLAKSTHRSADLFHWSRLAMLVVFWVNLSLIVLCTGTRLLSRKGLAVLILAGTLAPMWDYGFEVRHDNLVLTVVLFMWWLGRVRPCGLGSYTALGFLAVLAQFIAFKSFVYVLPLTALFLAFPPRRSGHRWLHLAGAWAAGAAGGLLICRLIYGWAGLWSVFKLAQTQGISVSTAQGQRFGVWLALNRPLTQTPLLLGLTAAALAWLALGFLRRKQTIGWEGILPEAGLCLGCLGALLVNPTPFPYNLVNVVPGMFILSFRFLYPLLKWIPSDPTLASMAGGILLFTHLVPFTTSTLRHLDWTNDRQELLMATAEAFTDPAKDPVYDAIGMVTTRRSINYHWYLHSLNLDLFTSGKLPGVARMLEEQPAAVVITSYRTDWLPKSDVDFITRHYLPLTNDFWVLGQVLPAGGGVFSPLRPGRYLVSAEVGGRLDSGQTILVDGRAAPSDIAQLGREAHTIACNGDVKPICIWLGPKLDRLPSIPSADHRRLFVNWY